MRRTFCMFFFPPKLWMHFVCVFVCVCVASFNLRLSFMLMLFVSVLAFYFIFRTLSRTRFYVKWYISMGLTFTIRSAYCVKKHFGCARRKREKLERLYGSVLMHLAWIGCKASTEYGGRYTCSCSLGFDHYYCFKTHSCFYKKIKIAAFLNFSLGSWRMMPLFFFFFIFCSLIRGSSFHFVDVFPQRQNTLFRNRQNQWRKLLVWCGGCKNSPLTLFFSRMDMAWAKLASI